MMDPLKIGHGAQFDQLLSLDDPTFDFFDDPPQPMQSVVMDSELTEAALGPDEPMDTMDIDRVDSPMFDGHTIYQQDSLAEGVLEEEDDEDDLPSQEDNLRKLREGWDEEAFDDFMGHPGCGKYRIKDEPLVPPIWHGFSVSPKPERNMGGGRYCS